MNALMLYDKTAKKEVTYLVHFDRLYLAPSGGAAVCGAAEVMQSEVEGARKTNTHSLRSSATKGISSE